MASVLRSSAKALATAVLAAVVLGAEGGLVEDTFLNPALHTARDGMADTEVSSRALAEGDEEEIVDDENETQIEDSSTQVSTSEPSSSSESATSESVTNTGTTPAPRPKAVISGSATLSVPDAAAFCADDQALGGVANVLASRTGRPSTDVDVACDARRLSEGKDLRRLQESISLLYTIVIESNSSDADSISASSPAVVDVVDMISSLDTTTLQGLLESEFEALGLDLAITVQELSAPSVEVQSPGTTLEATTTAANDPITDLSSRPTLGSGILAATILAATAVKQISSA